MPTYPQQTDDEYSYALEDSSESKLYSNRPLEDYQSGSIGFGVGIASLFASGFISTGKGTRLWDKYVPAIRAAEEYSPGAILRTLQISSALSQFERVSESIHISPTQFTENQNLHKYIATLIGENKTKGRSYGKNLGRLIQEGITLKDGKLYWGTGTEVALEHAAALKVPDLGKDMPRISRHYGNAYANSLGVSSHDIVTKIDDIMSAQIIGGENIFQHTWRQATAWGTEGVARFNRLLDLPFEQEPFATLFTKAQQFSQEKLGLSLKLSVQHGSGLQMLGRLSVKYGLGLAALGLGYESIDYAMRNTDLFNSTIFDEGLTAAIGTAAVNTNLALSKAANLVGLHTYREKQEEIAPGSTSLTKLMAVPATLALFASTATYLSTVASMMKKQYGGMTATEARAKTLSELERFGSGFLADIGKSVTTTQGLYSRQDWIGKLFKKIATPESTGELNFKFIGKMGPAKLAGVIGGIVGTALIAPFLPGALVPSERPEKLEDIYSGRKEVVVRKGRWWEFGRCLSMKSIIYTDYGIYKTIDSIKEGDFVLTKSGQKKKVLSVCKRLLEDSEEVFEIRSALDRTNCEILVTDKHPLLTVDGWKNAKDVVCSDWLAFPKPIITNQIDTFDGIPLNSDTGFMIGHYLAEGNLMRKRGQIWGIEICSAIHEKEYLEKDQEVILRYWNKNSKILEKSSNHIFRLRPGSKELGNWIYKLLYWSGDKLLPSNFLEFNRDFLIGLVDGYWKGDGGEDKGMKYITGARLGLLKQVQAILLALDIPVSILEHGSFSKQVKKFCTSWKLMWNAHDSHIETCPIRKNIRIDNQYVYGRVYKKELVDYNSYVMDLEIEDDHSFIGPGFILHNTPWEGERIMYYRPHWYPRLLQRSREKSIYNEQEGEEISPLSKFFKREFTYDLEKEHYRDRPYPITSLPFEDVPLIGPLLANTVGRLIKPPRLMHTEEWINNQGETVVEPGQFGTRIATEIGELPPGQPVSPYSMTSTIGEQMYRMTEMAGLLGYTAGSVKEILTGSDEFFDQASQLESARRMFGKEREYWDLEIGGGLGTTEAYRRLFPHRRRQIDLYNPIRNTMPEWLPGPGERGPDLLHGDPYASIQEGELRLPGVGYEARFPELKGINPEDYPDIHKYKILADVAPFTDKFDAIGGRIEARRKAKDWSEYEENIYQQTREQLKARKQRKEFDEYKYLSPTGDVVSNDKEYYRNQADESSSLIAALNQMKASKEKDPGLFAKVFGGYWETLSHNIETPIDTLTPVSPAAKFMHQRTAIEDYERTQLYGTSSAFWNKPLENFLFPFLRETARSFGYKEIPEPIEKKRDLESYFDILEYVKATRLANEARAAGDEQAVSEFEQKKSETLFGVNPFTRKYTSLYRALPKAERDYFSSFEKAKTTEERQRILEMVPENEKSLYLARWKLAMSQDIKAAQKANLLSEDQLKEADTVLNQIYSEARAEGFPYDNDLMKEYTETAENGESYGDWYRRTKILPQVALPGPDWVGWHPSVDLEDVKLKVVTSLGEEMHDYDLWESRLKALANKPYIDEAAIDPIVNPQEENRSQELVNRLLLANKVRGNVYSTPSFGQKDTYQVDLHQDVDIEALLKGAVNGV